MTDVNGTSIPILIVEEVNNIDEMENGYNDHGWSDMAELLILIGCP